MSATKQALHTYTGQLDATWHHLEEAITAFGRLNDVVWIDDETWLEVPGADGQLLANKIKELQGLLQQFRAAEPIRHRMPVAMPQLPSLGSKV